MKEVFGKLGEVWESLKVLEAAFVAPASLSVEELSIDGAESETEKRIECERKLVIERLRESEQAARSRQNEYFRKSLLNLQSSVMNK